MSSAPRFRAARSRSPPFGTRTILINISGSIATVNSDYAIFGGEDHKTGQVRNTETCFRKVEKALLKFAPQAKIDHRWSGQVIETNDGLPYIGPNEAEQFIATGYCGNGYTFGVIAAMMARDWITGVKNPGAICLVRTRKKLRGGTWDYLRENKDYPYYLIQDRFRAPEGKSLRAVKRGEGKILSLGRKKVAVYRDKSGQRQKDVRRLHAHGLPRPLESSRMHLGLPLPRLTFRGQRQSPRRSRGNAALIRLAIKLDSLGV